MHRRLSNDEWADQFEERLIDFAAEVILLTDGLPGTMAGRHIADQLLRSGTSPAPNFSEARGAESTADFIHKLKLAIKELNETGVWLRILNKSRLRTSNNPSSLLGEARELSRIVNASIRTAKSNRIRSHHEERKMSATENRQPKNENR